MTARSVDALRTALQRLDREQRTAVSRLKRQQRVALQRLDRKHVEQRRRATVHSDDLTLQRLDREQRTAVSRLKREQRAALSQLDRKQVEQRRRAAAEFYAAHSDDLTIEDVAEATGDPETTVRRALSSNGVPPRPRGPRPRTTSTA